MTTYSTNRWIYLEKRVLKYPYKKCDSELIAFYVCETTVAPKIYSRSSLHYADDEDIAIVEAATLKQAYAGLVTMILEAVKVDCDSSSIR